MRASVILATRNRPETLAETLAGLRRQSLPPDEYEVIVVDDGSEPPVVLPEWPGGPALRLLRTSGVERSIARNTGAEAARGEVLVFTDDDMGLPPEFVECHLRAQAEWPGALAVGAVRLPPERLGEPFVRFRQRLESDGLPGTRGPVSAPGICTAQNASIRRDRFLALGGFDPGIVSSEDQDLAMRHAAAGGTLVFLPEAEIIHRDRWLDLRGYCGRAEWGMEHMLPFIRRHPDWPDNQERHRLNGPVRWGREPLTISLKKSLRGILAWPPATELLYRAAAHLERTAPNSPALDRLYRTLLGAALLRGYRRALRK